MFSILFSLFNSFTAKVKYSFCISSFVSSYSRISSILYLFSLKYKSANFFVSNSVISDEGGDKEINELNSDISDNFVILHFWYPS